MNRTKLNLSSLLALALVTALIGTMPGIAHAQPDVAFNGTVAPSVEVTADHIALGIKDRSGNDITAPSFGIDHSGTAQTLLQIGSSALSADWQSSDVELTLEASSVPSGGQVSATVTSSSSAEQTWSSSNPSISLPAGESAELSWSFSQPGEYHINISAHATLTRSADSAEQTDTSGETSITVTVTGPPVVEEPQQSEEDGVPPDVNAQPGDEDEDDPTDPERPGVLDSGDVRFAAKLEDGEYDLQLLQVDEDQAGGEWHDPASTVISIPESEPWPGAGANGSMRTNWQRLVPDESDIWRTESPISGGDRANQMWLGLDAGYVSRDEVTPGTTQFSFQGAQTEADGYFTSYSTFTQNESPTVTGIWSTQPGAEQSAVKRANEGTGDRPSDRSVRDYGFVFTAPGVYCLILGVTTQQAGSSDSYTAEAAFTVVVGGDDPGGVIPCAQPGDEDEDDPTDPERPGVLDSGDVRFAAKLEDGELSQGLLTVDAARRQVGWADPGATVIFLTDQDEEAWPIPGHTSDSALGRAIWQAVGDEGDHLFRTRPTVATRVPGASQYFSNTVSVSFDASFVDNDELSSLTVKFDVAPLQADSSDSYLTTFQADSSGRLQATNGSNWDTRKEGYKGTIQQDAGSGYFNWGGDVATSQTEGLAFSEPGRYCVTMRSQVTLADTEEPTEAYATYTFAVGVDPENVEQCEQVDGGVVDPNSGDEDELLPDVNYLEKGHVDIGPTFESDDLRINAFYDIGGGEHEEMSLDDTIFVLKSQFGKHTATARESFFAEEGSDYWLFPQDGSIQHSLLWPGWSSAHLGVPAERGVKFRLLGVDGPEGGEAAVYSDSALQGSPAGVYFGTTTGLPGTREVRASHVHSNWAFTQPGVYCLTIESSVRGVEGDGVVSIAQEQLTVAVGDVSLTGVQPCSRVQDPVVAELPPLDADSIDDTPYSLSSDQALITPFVGEDGRIDAFARTQGDLAQDRILRDVESVVFTAPRQAGSQWMGAATGEVQWDGTYLDQDAIIEMGEVDGPGRFRDYTSWHTFDSADSDLGPGTLWQGRQHPTGYRLYAPGVYCVPWTFSVDGESVTKTLTYFAGDGDPASVELCADGGEATDPGEDPGNGEDPEEDIEWEVPNGSNTKSGARIINDGHVDVASVLSGRTLDTKIKDDTTGTGSPDYLDPEKTVLQVTPFAQTTVTSAAQGFIADVGDTVWQVNETPQDGLLWPGWSTERVPLNATTNGVNWKLNAVDGPGEVAVFANGAERVYFNTKDGITAADQFEIPKNTHTHANWTFTAEGVYCMAWERSTTLTNGNRVMDSFVTAFAVGEVNVRDIDPAKCFTEPAGKPGDDERGQSPTNLTDGNAGEVQVLGGENGFTSGQLVTVQVGREYVGEWVSMWIGTEWMGWAYVGESGAAQARIPVGVQPGGHRLAVMDRDGALIGWDSLNIVRAKTPGSGGTPAPDGRPAAQQVAAEQCVAGATILSAGHIDYSSRIVGGKLESLIGDDTSGTKVYREPSGTILWLKPESRKGGVWQVPQTQNPNLIWLGWSTEALHRGNARGSVQWTIDSISGPGTLTVYTSGVFGGVQETVFANGGSKSIGLGVHAHANWDFSAEGIYRITSTQTITLANGQRSSDTETLTIAVGNVDPASAAAETGGSGCGVVSNAMLLDDEDADKAAQAAAQAKAEAAKAARDRLPGGESGTLGITNPFTALTDGDPVPLLLSILASLLSAGAVGSGVMWWRRRQLSLL